MTQKNNEEFEVNDDNLREEIFQHAEQEGDRFEMSSSYVEDSEDEKEEIRRYQEMMAEIKKQNRPRKVIKWKPAGIILLEIQWFLLKFIFFACAIFYILWLTHSVEFTLSHIINTGVLTIILFIFKNWWKS
jgi:Flp pilus assembly protein TadB